MILLFRHTRNTKYKDEFKVRAGCMLLFHKMFKGPAQRPETDKFFFIALELLYNCICFSFITIIVNFIVIASSMVSFLWCSYNIILYVRYLYFEKRTEMFVHLSTKAYCGSAQNGTLGSVKISSW